MKKKYVKARHKFFFWLARPIAWIFARKFHFTTKRFKIHKGQNYFILANHQSYFEPPLMVLTFKKPIYFVGTDALYSKKLHSRLLFYCFQPIKKRRGALDIDCIRTMRNIAREGGNVALFPEGNRQFNDSVFHIDIAVCKLVRMLGLPLILYNFNGGYGVNPRWSKCVRKGKHVGTVRKVISVEEINAMTDQQLLQEIRTGLKVIDSESGLLYKSKHKAEFLEREVFICPKCHSYSTLHSHGDVVSCSHCGLQVTYGEDLHLSSTDETFTFHKLLDWYEFQLEEIRNKQIAPNQVLVSDANGQVFDKSAQQRVLVGSGAVSLDSDHLRIGEFSIATSEIDGACVQDGNKFIFNSKNKSYIVIGDDRFNALKYVLYFNRVCQAFVEKGGDKYYGLTIAPENK